MGILFINASPNKDGKTVQLANTLLAGKECSRLDLVDYKVYGYGQDFPDDRFDEILAEVRAAETIVIGSPVYWYNLSGMLRNVLDRFYGPVEEGSLSGKKLFFLFQGAAPTEDMLAWGDYTMSRFAALYGMEYAGMATSDREAQELASKL